MVAFLSFVSISSANLIVFVAFLFWKNHFPVCTAKDILAFMSSSLWFSTINQSKLSSVYNNSISSSITVTFFSETPMFTKLFITYCMPMNSTMPVSMNDESIKWPSKNIVPIQISINISTIWETMAISVPYVYLEPLLVVVIKHIYDMAWKLAMWVRMGFINFRITDLRKVYNFRVVIHAVRFFKFFNSNVHLYVIWRRAFCT